MRFDAVANTLAWIALPLSAAMLLPALSAVVGGDLRTAQAFAAAALLSAFVSGAVLFATRAREAPWLGKNESYLLVVLAWPLLAALGALPFLLLPLPGDTVTFLFEAVSGLTTTAASGFETLAGLPPAVLLWRALLHWLGGFLTILLAVVVFSNLGAGGMLYFHSALPRGEGLSVPVRLAQTARDLGWVYALLTLLCAIGLWLTGVPTLDGLGLAFGALSTGGVAMTDGGVPALSNPAAEWVLMAFMLIGAINFTLHWAVVNGRWRPFVQNVEVRYLLLAVIVIGLGLALWFWRTTELGPLASLHAGLFSAASLLSTTGTTTTLLPEGSAFPAILVIGLVLVGGAAASTAGGVKLFRVAILFKQARRELARLVHPHGVLPLKIGQQVVGQDVVTGVWSFFFVLVLALAATTVLLAAGGIEPMAAVALATAALSNAGPVAQAIEPAVPAYASLAVGNKLILMLAMVLGRIEILAFLVLINPTYWRH